MGVIITVNGGMSGELVMTDPDEGSTDLSASAGCSCSSVGSDAVGSVMISAPRLAPLVLEARKRERVRCSSLVDWPVYPRLRRIMQGSERARNAGPAVGWPGSGLFWTERLPSARVAQARLALVVAAVVGLCAIFLLGGH